MCWAAFKLSFTECGFTLDRYCPAPLPAENIPGRPVHACMVPYLLGSAFVKMKFRLEANIKEEYVTVSAMPISMRIIHY